jgi:hypothetical protein
MNADNRFPLAWPVGWPRSRGPQRARFGARGRGATVNDGVDLLWNELRRLGARDVVISTDVILRSDGWPSGSASEPADHGAAVYFTIKGQPRALACDKWDRVADNLQALGKHVEAIRGQLRWGVGSVEQAFGGYKALPAVGARVDWHVVLGVAPSASWEEIQRRRRELLEQHHPDRGGDPERAAAVNEAFGEARAARGMR